MKRALMMVVLMVWTSIFCHASKEMDQLQTDVKDIQKQMAALQQSIKDVTLQMVNIQANLQQQMSGIQKNSADIALKVDDLSQRMQVMTEKIQTTNSQLDKISLQLAQPVMAPPTVQPPTAGGPVAGSFSSLPTATTPTPTASTSGVPPPEQIYNTAYTDYIKGNFDLAIAGFRQYLTSYPTTQLSDNAQYWIGECFYSQKKYEQAVEEFTKSIVNFPQGDKLPSAMLKKGYALLELYKTSDAVNVLQLLIDKYPTTDEARIAKQRLADLGLRPR